MGKPPLKQSVGPEQPCERKLGLLAGRNVEVEIPVSIPTRDGKGVAETVPVKVPALRDPKDGETYLTEEALRKLDDTKARHMGLLLPEQIRDLRQSLHLKQREISELLQIGEKTWTRWESGRERPSRSLNVMLQALMDGKIDVAYLRMQLDPALQQKPLTPQIADPGKQSPAPTVYTTAPQKAPTDETPALAA